MVAGGRLWNTDVKKDRVLSASAGRKPGFIIFDGIKGQRGEMDNKD
jgi:hypothetical protein